MNKPQIQVKRSDKNKIVFRFEGPQLNTPVFNSNRQLVAYNIKPPVVKRNKQEIKVISSKNLSVKDTLEARYTKKRAKEVMLEAIQAVMKQPQLKGKNNQKLNAIKRIVCS
tara:strand:- start:4354 stop:4686 length:333 start_codon:yes stop_codon:yes gene_type:complete